MKRLRQTFYNAKVLAKFIYEQNIAELRKRRSSEQYSDAEEAEAAIEGWELIDEKGGLNSWENSSDDEYDTHDFSQMKDGNYSLPEQTFRKIACNFPPFTFHKKLQLIYGSFRDGYSLQTLLRMSAKWAYDRGDISSDFSIPCVLVITDTNGHSFGAYCTHLLRETEREIIGKGEMKLFKVKPSLEIYSWSGMNDYFLNCSKEHICIGGSEARGFGPALWICEDLSTGRSMKCETFNSDILSSQEDFTISEIEIWGFS